jgi:secondary thiamine-phosphate synthase enzyme
MAQEIEVSSKGNTDIIDITGDLKRVVEASGVKEGIACLSVAGSTASLTTVEFEPGLVADLKRAFEQIAPEDAPYAHEARWHDDNGHSHVRASLVGPSLCLPVSGGAPVLGTWQQVVMIDFDTRPRTRTVAVQVVGE